MIAPLRENVLRLLGRLRRTPRKRDLFSDLTEQYAARLERWPRAVQPAPGGRRVGVLVTPWLTTAVPMLAIECGFMLAEAGCDVTAIVDTTDVVGNSPKAKHAGALQQLAAPLVRQTRGLSPGGIEPLAHPDDLAHATELFHSNAVWKMRGEQQAPLFLAQHRGAEKLIAQHLGRVRRLLSAERFDLLLIPGGIFGLSGIYVAIARELGIHFATWDGGASQLRLAYDGVAAQLADLPRSFAALRASLTPAERDAAIEAAKAELAIRVEARHDLLFQMSAATGQTTARYDLLVPLNVRWDSAALGRERCFASMDEWLTALLEWLTDRPDLSICLRQHPRERLAFARGSDRMVSLIEQFAHLGTRLRFVAADEEINTYDLMRESKVVLCYNSTVGIEAAMLGKPVVLSAAAYYEDFGFSAKATSREAYFAQLENALTSAGPDATQRESAALAYYLTQLCARVRTCFTGHPDDFDRWVKLSPDELWAMPETSDFRTALLEDEPLPLVRHRRLVHGH